jgi:hypothetical protein
VITKTVEEVRTGWGPLAEAVLASDDPKRAKEREEVAIARTRGRPADRVEAGEIVAILVPIGWYRSIPAELRPADDEVRVMKSSEARNNLADVLLETGRGVHTVITFYGTQRAVFVSPVWHQQHSV